MLGELREVGKYDKAELKTALWDLVGKHGQGDGNTMRKVYRKLRATAGNGADASSSKSASKSGTPAKRPGKPAGAGRTGAEGKRTAKERSAGATGGSRPEKRTHASPKTKATAAQPRGRSRAGERGAAAAHASPSASAGGAKRPKVMGGGQPTLDRFRDK